MFEVGIVSVFAIFLLLQGGECMLELVLAGRRISRRAPIDSQGRAHWLLAGSSIARPAIWFRAIGICPYGIAGRRRGGGSAWPGLQMCRENVWRSLTSRE